jgi:hypothetical protein
VGLLFDIGLHVPNGLRENRNNIGHELNGPLRCTDDKMIKNGEETSLNLSLASSLDLMEKMCGEQSD